MRCLAPGEIDRFISGIMDEVVAGGVTQHLAGCRRCRDSVSKARTATADTRLISADEREGSQVTHLPVRCQRCGAQYAIPEERARGRRLTVRCMSCGGQMEVEGDKSGTSSPSLLTGETGERCWYLVEERERKGPYSELDLCKKIEKGQIGADTHIWRDGYSEWRRLGTLPQFQAMLGAPQTVPRTSTDPFPPAPPSPYEHGAPGYDPRQVANSMLAGEPMDTAEDSDTDSSGWRRSTDQLPMVSSVSPGPVQSGGDPLKTALIDPLEDGAGLSDPSESEILTVLRPADPGPEEVSESALRTALHTPDQPVAGVPRSVFRLESESEVSTELHEPGYAPDETAAQKMALALPTAEDGDPTHRAGQVERTAEIEAPGGEDGGISDEARTRIHYTQQDPRAGLLDDDDEGAADELAPLFDEGPGSLAQETPPLETPPLETAPHKRPAREEPQEVLVHNPPPEARSPAQPRETLNQGTWDRRMQGERHDNSVLFSLQHLKNLAGPASLPREESGLVDIQLIPGMDMDAPAPAPLPLIIASSSESSNKTAMLLTVGMLGVMLGAVALLTILYLARPEIFSSLLGPGRTTPAAAASPPAPAPAAVPKPVSPVASSGTALPAAGDGPDAAAPSPDSAPGTAAGSPDAAPASPTAASSVPTKVAARKAEPRPARAPGPAHAPGRSPSASGPSESSKPASRSSRVEKAKAPSPSEAMDPFAATAQPKPKPKPSASVTDQELDDLIDAATRGDLPPSTKPKPRRKQRPKSRSRSKPVATAQKADTSGLSAKLARHQVSAGMKRSSPAVARCRKKHNRVGLVTVSVTISGNTGRVKNGQALGPLGNTPVGSCVLKAVKSTASFPRFSGPPITIKYPFILR